MKKKSRDEKMQRQGPPGFQSKAETMQPGERMEESSLSMISTKEKGSPKGPEISSPKKHIEKQKPGQWSQVVVPSEKTPTNQQSKQPSPQIHPEKQSIPFKNDPAYPNRTKENNLVPPQNLKGRQDDRKNTQPRKSQHPPIVSPPPNSWNKKVGSKPQQIPRPISNKNHQVGKYVTKNEIGGNELALYLPQLPVKENWNLLTQPLLKNNGHLHQKIMSNCGCKISISGKNETMGSVVLTSDVGETQNVIRATNQLLNIFNKVLAENNLPTTTIAQLTSSKKKIPIDQMKPKPVAKQVPNNSHHSQSVKPSQPPVNSTSHQIAQPNLADTYKMKSKAREIMETSMRNQCRWCNMDCHDPNQCWFMDLSQRDAEVI